MRGRDDARAVQQRLLRLHRGVPAALGVAVGSAVLAAGLLVVQAWVVASVVAGAIAGRTPGSGDVALLAAAIAGRALLGGVTELAGRWGARLAMAALRHQITGAALRGRAAAIGGARRGEIVTAATQGVDALSDYYARAVPAVVLAGVVPAALVAVVSSRAPIVGLLLAITLPVVVVFMVLVGMRSAAHAEDRQHALAVLGAHFLEIVRGLPTLRAHGREGAQLSALRTITTRYRDESLAALRVAFLSALVLEMLAMLGTAIAAAVIGVQLAEGAMTLEVGLFVLLLAPEIYAPLRDAGQRFHAAQDGTRAAKRVLAFLDEPGPLTIDGGSGRGAKRPALRGAGDHQRGAAAGAGAALTLRGATVHGGEGRLDALAPIDLVVGPGRSVAIVGPSGTGKSTILALLARLRDPDAGVVQSGMRDLRTIEPEAWWQHVAFLAQRPALPAGRLGVVLRAAATPADATTDRPTDIDSRLDLALGRADALQVVADLDAGLATAVGPGGRALSAGQEQRLCLAAALASRAPLLLLDEPTAHLDAASAERVRQGILAAAAGRTLVVATHDLDLAACCDDVVQLASAGLAPGPNPSGDLGGTATAAADAIARVRPATGPGPAQPGAEPERAPAAAARRRPGRPLMLGAASALAGVAVLAVSGWLIVRASERPPVLALLSTIVLVRALGFVRALGRYGERLSGHDAVLGELAERRVDWYARLTTRIGAPDLPTSAELLTRFTADVDALQDRTLRVRQPVAVAGLVVAASTLAAALILPAAAVALLAGALAGGVLGPAAAWVVGWRAAARQAPARGILAAQLDEVVQLGPALALIGLAGDRRRGLHASAARLARADRALAWAAAIGGALTTLGGGVALAGTLIVASRATAQGQLAPVALGAVVLLAVGVLEFLRPLPEAALRLVAVQRAEARLRDVTDGPPALAPPPRPPQALPPGAPLRADRLSYRPGGPAGPLVLRDVSLVVEPGERVAIVGPSGAGKSTLLALLGRLADPDRGVVSLGATDLRRASVATVRERLRVAGQDAHLLAGTVAANLRIGRPEATSAELDAVLRDVGLGPWLAALPDGLQTLVGEDGTAVSGGQRQRLGVARALLSSAELVLLDEPTAMLDADAAAALLRDALHAAAGRTLVVVTHDGDRLDHFDRVLELRDGHLHQRTPAAPAAAIG